MYVDFGTAGTATRPFRKQTRPVATSTPTHRSARHFIAFHGYISQHLRVPSMSRLVRAILLQSLLCFLLPQAGAVWYHHPRENMGSRKTRRWHRVMDVSPAAYKDEFRRNLWISQNRAAFFIFTKTCVQALSDVDEEGESGSKRGREVIIDGHGLVTLCPDLGYYDGPAGARRNYGAASPGPNDGPSPSMQVKRNDSSHGVEGLRFFAFWGKRF